MKYDRRWKRGVPWKEHVNGEGLTWAEWVCAAGQALYIPCLFGHHVDGCFLKTPAGAVVAHGFTNYPNRLIAAWSSGVDPTEYRSSDEY